MKKIVKPYLIYFFILTISNIKAQDLLKKPYAFGKNRGYFTIQKGFTEKSKNNIGLECEIGLSNLVGIVGSYGKGQLNLTNLYRGVLYNFYQDYKGYTLGLKFHTAAIAENNFADVGIGVSYVKSNLVDDGSNLIDFDKSYSGLGLTADLRIPILTHLGLNLSVGKAFTNSKQTNFSYGVGLFLGIFNKNRQLK